MRRERTRDDDVARAPLHHVRQNVVHVLHHDIDVEVEHPVDGARVGVDEVAADVKPRIGVQDVEPARMLEHARQKRRAVLWVEQVDDQRDDGVAVLLAQSVQRRLVSVDHRDARAKRQHGLGAGQPDA